MFCVGGILTWGHFNCKSKDIIRLLAPLLQNILEFTKIVSEYDQEIPQSQTADNPVAP